MFLSSLESFFYHQEFGYYLQIKHNRRCLPQSERFPWSWFFLVFVIILKKQRKKKKEKSESVL
jgi:hypothetical protein